MARKNGALGIKTLSLVSVAKRGFLAHRVRPGQGATAERTGQTTVELQRHGRIMARLRSMLCNDRPSAATLQN